MSRIRFPMIGSKGSKVSMKQSADNLLRKVTTHDPPDKRRPGMTKKENRKKSDKRGRKASADTSDPTKRIIVIPIGIEDESLTVTDPTDSFTAQTTTATTSGAGLKELRTKQKPDIHTAANINAAPKMGQKNLLFVKDEKSSSPSRSPSPSPSSERRLGMRAKAVQSVVLAHEIPTPEQWTEIEDYSAYFGCIEASDLEFLLNKNGDFLLRSKLSFPRSDVQHNPPNVYQSCPLILTAKLQNKTMHYKLYVRPKQDLFIIGCNQKKSLSELITHHINNKIVLPNASPSPSINEEPRILKTPIIRPQINFGPLENVVFDAANTPKKDEHSVHDVKYGTLSKAVPFKNSVNHLNDRRVVVKVWEIKINISTLKSLKGMIRVQNLYESTHLLATSGFIWTETHFYLVSPLSEKGSLQSYLKENKVTLEIKNKYKFSSDIAEGMSFLEKIKVCHGRLTSKNCIMGIQGTKVLISDFKPVAVYLDGLKHAKITPYSARYIAKEIIEALQTRQLTDEMLNIEADCWSYGVLLYEIFEMEPPYSNFNTEELFNYVLSGYRLDPVLAGEELRDHIRQCFDNNPQNRPKFEKLHSRIRQLYHSSKKL